MKIRIIERNIYDTEIEAETIAEAKDIAMVDYMNNLIDKTDQHLTVETIGNTSQNEKKAHLIMSALPELEMLSGRAYDQAIDIISDILSIEN